MRSAYLPFERLRFRSHDGFFPVLVKGEADHLQDFKAYICPCPLSVKHVEAQHSLTCHMPKEVLTSGCTMSAKQSPDGTRVHNPLSLPAGGVLHLRCLEGVLN